MKPKIRDLMLEYSYRVTGQGVPQAPGDGHIHTSNPNVVTGDTMHRQQPTNDASDKKVFDDEQKAYDDAFIMPYTLDRVNDVMVDVVNGAAEARIMLDQTLTHPSINEPQAELIKRRINTLAKIQKAAIAIVHDIDSLTITAR